MSCECDYDPADVWVETLRKSRKEYVCYECREKIEKGDDYVEYSILSDGDWSRHRLCDCCHVDWENLVELGHCKMLGALKESIKEAWERNKTNRFDARTLGIGDGLSVVMKWD